MMSVVSSVNKLLLNFPILFLMSFQMEEVNQEVCISSKEVEDCNNQVVDLKRQLQTLEIDLQAQLCLVSISLINTIDFSF